MRNMARNRGAAYVRVNRDRFFRMEMRILKATFRVWIISNAQSSSNQLTKRNERIFLARSPLAVPDGVLLFASDLLGSEGRICNPVRRGTGRIDDQSGQRQNRANSAVPIG